MNRKKMHNQKKLLMNHFQIEPIPLMFLKLKHLNLKKVINYYQKLKLLLTLLKIQLMILEKQENI